MIGKSISYAHLFNGITLTSSADRRALFAGWAVAKYILGFELEEQEIMLLREASAVATYGPDNRGDPERVLDAVTFNLEEASAEDQALEFAYRVAAAGKNSLRQIVVAYGDEQISVEMAARHREIFLRVLRAENKPVIYSNHGDTGYGHFHLAICTADSNSGKVGEWGQGMEIEALHIALAICEAQDDLKPEPNRRYVADETGVYHSWSGFKVADANGDIINRGVFKAVRAEQVEFDLEVLSPEDGYVGQALPTPKAIKLLSRGVIRHAKTWDQVHRGLARMGIRYEPYYAEGEIAGGHLVAHGVLDKEDDRIPASHVNAGYKRLCKKLGDRPYQPAASDIHVRPFAAPAYRKMEDDSAEDLSLDNDLQEQIGRQAQINRELEEFEAALRARCDAIEGERVEGAKARRKMKTLEEKRRHHNRQQRCEKASRQESEKILRELGLAFDREAGRKRRGPRPKVEPATTVLWGETPDRYFNPEKRPGEWSKRYSIEASDHSRTYRLNGEIAFVESSNFVAVHSEGRQAKVDALRCAHEKFGKVRIVGPASFRREMLLLAAEMKIPLEAKQAKEAAKLLAKSKESDQREDEVAYDSSWFPLPKKKKPKPLSAEEFRDAQDRVSRGKRFNVQVLRDFHRKNAQEDAARARGKPNSAKLAIAHQFLWEMDCDRMLLCASSNSPEGIRFLDDEELLKKFVTMPHALVRPEIQRRLEAIRRVQDAKREWIYTGLAKGEFQLRGEKLTIPDSYGAWPSNFILGQRRDPAFMRTLREAAEGDYSGELVDLSVRPEVAVWREARSGSERDHALAPYIVDELMRTSDPSEREVLFGNMSYDEATMLRRTEGQAATAYRGQFFRKGDKSNRQLPRREMAAKRSDRESGRSD